MNLYARIDWMWVVDGVIDRLAVYGLVIGAMFGFSPWGPNGISVALLMYCFISPVCIPNSVQNLRELALNFLLLLIWVAFVLVLSCFVHFFWGGYIGIGLILGLEICAWLTDGIYFSIDLLDKLGGDTVNLAKLEGGRNDGDTGR